ncbi:MAG TPA: hypothetical protein VGK36_15665 [Candidatus Angelobacter sp.]|jgi:hypothetical protein
MNNTFNVPSLTDTEKMDELMGFEMKEIEVACSADAEKAGITGCLSCS